MTGEVKKGPLSGDAGGIGVGYNIVRGKDRPPLWAKAVRLEEDEEWKLTARGGGGFLLNIGSYSFFLLFSLMKRHVLGVYTQYTV